MSLASAAALALSAPADARSHHHGIPTGYYQCYQTIQDVSPVNGGVSYSTSFVGSFTLLRNGTYDVLGDVFSGDNHWKYSKGKLKFSSGPMWSGFRHAAGTYSKSGKLMPNAVTLSATARYQLVLHDARTNDSDTLPHRESAAASLWYCKKR